MTESRKTVYKAAIRQGLAGDLCDKIVASRPVPPMLLAVLRYRRLSIRPGLTRELWAFKEPMPTLLTGKRP